MIVDQQNSDGGTDIVASYGVLLTTTGAARAGQSFVPNLAAMDFVRLVVASTGTATYRLDLLLGAGLNGPVLGSSPARVLPGTREAVTFDFATPIVLVPRNVYTFSLVRETGTGNELQYRISLGDRYAEGAIYSTTNNPGGSPVSSLDFDFVEGLTHAPEPTSLAALAGVALVATRRKRH